MSHATTQSAAPTTPEIEREDILARNAATGDTAVLAKLLSRRYSCRAFLPKPAPREHIAQIVSLAQLSASWCNSQPWQLIVTEGETTERFRREMYAYMAQPEKDDRPDFDFPAAYVDVYQVRRRETARRLYESVGVNGDREASKRQTLENFRLFGAPHVALITTNRELGVYGAVDCGLFVGNFLMLAESMGLATIPQAALARCPNFIRKFFDLPQDRLVVCGISFGYEDKSHPANAFRTSRAPVEDVIDWR